MQADCEECRVARRHSWLVYVDAERVFIGQSSSFLTNALNPQKG